MKKYLIIICLVLATLSAWLSHSLVKNRAECKRLQSNQEALMKSVELYETQAGESAASVNRLQLNYDDLERHYNNVCLEAKNLGIKVKRLQSVAQTGTHTDIKIQTEVKDSIIYAYKENLVYIDTVKWFSWHDPPWVDITGVIDSGRVNLNVQSVDTLLQIVHRVPKRFLFFRWGTKAIKQEIISKNPHAKIIYSDYIELKK
jgi:hypothetical protein